MRDELCLRFVGLLVGFRAFAKKLLSLESGFAATSGAQWHTNEARRKAQPAECNIVIFDREAERLLQYDVNGTRQHSQPFMGFLYRTKLHGDAT